VSVRPVAASRTAASLRRSSTFPHNVHEFVDRPVTRDDLVGVQEQDGEERTLLRTAERQRAVLADGLERSQESEVQGTVTSLAARMLDGC